MQAPRGGAVGARQLWRRLGTVLPRHQARGSPLALTVTVAPGGVASCT